MASQRLPLTLPLPPPPPSPSPSPSLPTFQFHHSLFSSNGAAALFPRLRHRRSSVVPSVGKKEDTGLRLSSSQQQQQLDDYDDDDEPPTPQDLQYVAQIKRVSFFFPEKIIPLIFFFLLNCLRFLIEFSIHARRVQVLELLRKNRDMLFGEVNPFFHHFFQFCFTN